MARLHADRMFNIFQHHPHIYTTLLCRPTSRLSETLHSFLSITFHCRIIAIHLFWEESICQIYQQTKFTLTHLDYCRSHDIASTDSDRVTSPTHILKLQPTDNTLQLLLKGWMTRTSAGWARLHAGKDIRHSLVWKTINHHKYAS